MLGILVCGKKVSNMCIQCDILGYFRFAQGMLNSFDHILPAYWKMDGKVGLGDARCHLLQQNGKTLQIEKVDHCPRLKWWEGHGMQKCTEVCQSSVELRLTKQCELQAT